MVGKRGALNDGEDALDALYGISGTGGDGILEIEREDR